MSITIQIDTTRLDGLLAALPVIERGDEIKAGLRRGGELIATEQRRIAPRQAGATKDVLAGSISKKIVEGDHRVTAFVGPRATAGHARPVEFGHRVVVTHGPRKGEDTGRVAKAMPFVGPSADTVGPQAIAAVEALVTRAVEALANG